MNIKIKTLEQLRNTLVNIENNNIEPLTKKIESLRDLKEANKVEAEKLVKQQADIENLIFGAQFGLEIERTIPEEDGKNIEKLSQELAGLEEKKETITKKLTQNKEEREKLTTTLEDSWKELNALPGDQDIGNNNIKVEIWLENQKLDKNNVKDLVDLLKNESVEIGVHLKSCTVSDEKDNEIIRDAIRGYQINQKLNRLAEKFPLFQEGMPKVGDTKSNIYPYELRAIEQTLKEIKVSKEGLEKRLEKSNESSKSSIRNSLKEMNEVLTEALEAKTQRESSEIINKYYTKMKGLDAPQAETVERKPWVKATKSTTKSIRSGVSTATSTLSAAGRKVSEGAVAATRKLSSTAEHLSKAAKLSRYPTHGFFSSDNSAEKKASTSKKKETPTPSTPSILPPRKPR